MKKNQLKKIIEKDMLGKIPIYFSELTFFEREYSPSEVKDASATKFISVDDYQTDNHLIALAYRKLISLTIEPEKTDNE